MSDRQRNSFGTDQVDNNKTSQVKNDSSWTSKNHHPIFSDGYIHIATSINIIDEKKVHQKRRSEGHSTR